MLVQGEEPRRDRTRLWWAAVLLLALGAAAGWTVARETQPAPAQQSGTGLVAGSFEAATSGPPFVLSLYNVGDTPERVVNVSPRGWESSSYPTTVPPRGSVELPMSVRVNCKRGPTDDVVVRTRSGGHLARRILHLPAVPSVLADEFKRRCAMPTGHTPPRRDILGTWLVAEGRYYAGRMLFRLAADGTFTMDPGGEDPFGRVTTQVFAHPGTFGKFTYHGGLLALATQGGPDCQPAHSRWRMGLLNDGRLNIRVGAYDDAACGSHRGDVWIARRVSPPPDRTRGHP